MMISSSDDFNEDLCWLMCHSERDICECEASLKSIHGNRSFQPLNGAVDAKIAGKISVHSVMKIDGLSDRLLSIYLHYATTFNFILLLVSFCAVSCLFHFCDHNKMCVVLCAYLMCC